MRKTSVFIISLLILAGYAFGKDSQSLAPLLDFSPRSTMRSDLALSLQQSTKIDSTYLMKLHNHPDYILPKKALLFSVLIPGSGELYCRSYIKSAAFFGIEVVAWTMYVVYNQQGQEKDDEFKDYANENWNEDKWLAWFNTLTPEQQGNFSHTLPETKTQQYYEMIGKYNQFLVGWKEVPIDLSYDDVQLKENTSPLREHYMDMRAESNKLLKRAMNGVYIAMFNHVISAIDAAWTAKQHNSKLNLNTSLRLDNRYINNENHTMLSLNINW